MSQNEQGFSRQYYKRKLKANKIVRKIQAKKRQLRLLRFLCRILIIVLIILAGIYILKLPMWHINQELLSKGDKKVVLIVGNHVTPTYKIVDMIRQTEIPDTEIFRLDTKEIEENIKRLEPVKDVRIRRFWFPARFLVLINESEPVFTIVTDLEAEPYSAVSRDGVLIGRDYMPIKKSEGTIKVIVPNNLYIEWTKEKVNKILDAINIMEAYTNQKVKYVDIKKDDDLFFMLDEILIRVGALNHNYKERLKALVTILPEIDDYRNKIEYVDLRWETKYIKLKDTETKLF